MYKFSTYATWWIRQAIDRGLAGQTRTVRLPVHVVGELARFGRVERKLQNREPTLAEVAEAAGTSAERITDLRLAARSRSASTLPSARRVRTPASATSSRTPTARM